jgi:hypothetical protein
VTTVLTDQARHDADARPGGEALWIAAGDLERLTGYELKPEGACRDEVCVPLSTGLARDGEVDVAGFWRHTGHPVLHDVAGSVWLLAEGATARRSALESLQAPDFMLPDLEGTQHTLSEYRGKKVFLATWASW